MKNTMKLFLAMAIFCTVGMAGDQTNGGRNCDPNDPQPCNCTANCFSAGQSSPDIVDTFILVAEDICQNAIAFGL